jgi:osmoprotectant transport system permease protein
VSPPIGAPPNSFHWILGHKALIAHLFLQHLELTAIAVALGLVISLPLAVLSYRYRAVYGPVTSIAGLLYTIPSLALFVLFIPLTGLSVTTAEIGLTSYTLLILIRNIVVGLRGVPDDVKEAARGMGYTRRQLLWRVELPLALPAVVAGIRVATVSTIGLVTVAALIGKGGLGQLILQGLNILYPTEMLTGAVLSVVLALIVDAALLLGQRAVTPWDVQPVRSVSAPRKAGFPIG